MVKVFAIEFQSKLAHGALGGRRVDFSPGDKLVVSRKEEVVQLLRLGCKLIGEVDLGYDDITWPEPEKAPTKSTPKKDDDEDAPTGYAAQNKAALNELLASRQEEITAAELEYTGNEKKDDLVALLEKLDELKTA
jgi:hypothetical protein